MARLEADVVGVRTPGAPGQTSAAGTTNKLRDSCQACAMSKVKCPKEKPTCSRCEIRGLLCQYIFTRRPGRRREARRRSNAGISTRFSPSIGLEDGLPVEKDTIQVLQPAFEACFLSRSISPPTGSNNYLGMSPESLSIPASPRPDHVFATETSDMFFLLGEAKMFSALANFGSDGNDVDFIMSAMDCPFGIPVIDSGGMSEAQNDIGSLPIPSHGINVDLSSSSEIPSSLGPIIASSRVTAYAPDIQELETGHSEVTRAPDTPACGCLTQSLELLKMLSAQHVPQNGLSGSESNETQNATTSGPSHSVLTENKQSIDAVSERLTCPSCAGDSFLLAVLSMTVLKILERYAAAARAQPGGAETTHPEAAKTSRLANSILASSKSQMVVVSRTYNTPRHRGRRAAQLVLRELHHVQGLVNQLSPKLMRSKDRERRDLGPEELWGRLGRAGDHDRGPEAPFSATTLGQIESDVRKSLSALSSEIKNGLRQS